MEFNEKLSELRKSKGLTQEELAKALFVSRAAISKWESGRGYPTIDSLRAIATFFSVTVDELLSANQILSLAKEDGEKRRISLSNRIFGLLDVSMALLFFLPLFASRDGGAVAPSPLIGLSGIQPYMTAVYFIILSLSILSGILTLAFLNAESAAKHPRIISLSLSTLASVVFILSLQPYAAIFALTLSAIKAISLIKA